ncbi:uncharacterized protein [Nothobranchius furzeri]|uniref:uncharacterized protein n=1 Tax=Nothobranchius furzeri TaxID=105023 RepID=UPI003904CC66
MGGRVGEPQLGLIYISMARGFKERCFHSSAPVDTLTLVSALDLRLCSHLPEVYFTSTSLGSPWPPALHRLPALDHPQPSTTRLHLIPLCTDLIASPFSPLSALHPKTTPFSLSSHFLGSQFPVLTPFTLLFLDPELHPASKLPPTVTTVAMQLPINEAYVCPNNFVPEVQRVIFMALFLAVERTSIIYDIKQQYQILRSVDSVVSFKKQLKVTCSGFGIIF